MIRIKTKYWYIAAALLLVAVVTGCRMSDDDDDSEVKEYVKVGSHVPLFSVNTIAEDGTMSMFTTARLTGETVIVLFNTSCGDCQRELPRLNDYYLEHRNDAGFQMVAISREEEPESVAAFWKEKGLSMPYSPQPDRRIYGLFASAVIPRVYFCGADGIITKVLIEKW
jgi:thiol-disulfide isomerase/thioredoxin